MTKTERCGWVIVVVVWVAAILTVCGCSTVPWQDVPDVDCVPIMILEF